MADAVGSQETEHVDVLIVGAGLSGIGAGYHLQDKCPDRAYVILEGRDSLGGTWDLFRYPGVRSDSDMHTLGYSFKPWTNPKSIADGPSILSYVQETAEEYGIDKHIRFGHLVTSASWSTPDARWTVTANRTDADGAQTTVTLTCNFLFMCSGYYSYKGGYPQKWPDDLDYSDKRVVVIGSGATAMTLVPAMSDDAAHVTMLQRSPTYVVARPDSDAVANKLRKVLPAQTAYKITRWKNVRLSEMIYGKTRTNPDKIRDQLLGGVKEALGSDYDVDTHFTPTYNPWDQRLCLIPNGDLFKAINSGRATVVTDHVDTFTENGIRLASGEQLEADIIVTATGLQLVTVGDMDFSVDGEAVDFSERWTYKGLAYSDIPNMVSTFGYINASWTLRADLTCEWVCRLLNHMTETGTDYVTARLRPSDSDMPRRPWIDDFSSGYMQRMMALMPKQGDREPWLNTQRVSEDRKLIADAPIADDVLGRGEDRFPEVQGKFQAVRLASGAPFALRVAGELDGAVGLNGFRSEVPVDVVGDPSSKRVLRVDPVRVEVDRQHAVCEADVVAGARCSGAGQRAGKQLAHDR